jgi:hypothetical protein
MNPKRMEAEAVRDNILLVAGNLDLTLGGPDLDPDAGPTSSRRSLYFRHAKEKRVVFLRLFDSANVLSCYRRSESVVPQQALALANSPLTLAQARLLARSLVAETVPVADPAAAAAPREGAASSSPPLPPDPKFVTAAFERVLGREPTAEEHAACELYLQEQTRRLSQPASLTLFGAGPDVSVKPSADPALRARENLVHVLMNHNDFVTIR